MRNRHPQPSATSTLVSVGVWLSILPLAVATVPARARAQGLKSGADLYRNACAACHGRDGRGAPQSLVGLDIPLPDLTDCRFGTPEPDSDWMAVSHDGGPARAFDRRMPAFGEALSVEELQRVIDHIRTFCTNKAWPRGELNLPRAFITEKAFPENEVVITTAAATGAVGNQILYERRVGPRSMFEVKVPIDIAEQDGGGWQQGLGDVAFAVKHPLFHDRHAGSILSVAGEVVFPTGQEDQGLGKGVTIFEPFVAFGQILPADGFLQAQVGMELPAHRDIAQKEAFFRVAAGKSFSHARWGRTWSPMIEVLGARELVSGESIRLGSAAADAGDPEQAPAHHDERRCARTAERTRSPSHAVFWSTCCGTGSMAASSKPGGRRGGMNTRHVLTLVSVCWFAWLIAISAAPRAAQAVPPTGAHAAAAVFQTSHECLACHNGLTAPSGEDVSIEVDVAVRNLTGHKLPTGYPARRAWLHLVVRDRDGRPVFESGAVRPNGSIAGNDGDADAARYEPHHLEITTADQVQIYESVMADVNGNVTTGLLRGVRYVKDNRLLPRGFDKTTADADIRVQGGAMQDGDFTDAGDRVRYVVGLGSAAGPFRVEASLYYQTIACRWAQNLRPYDAAETKRFVSFYESMASTTGTLLGHDAATTR